MKKSKDDKNNTTTTITPSASDKTPIEIRKYGYLEVA